MPEDEVLDARGPLDGEHPPEAAPSAAATPRPPIATAAVIDLRDDLPSRHRSMRGVPREPDAHLAGYRDRAARPGHRHGRRPRLVDVAAVVEAPLAAPAPTHDVASGTATTDAPIAESSSSAPSATVVPTNGERRKLYVGELVVRRLRLRSVFKVALALNLCLLAVGMVAGALLWRLANEQGWVAGWTGFLVDIGFTDADVDGVALARASATIGGILTATATLLTVAVACLYNQIAGLIGGVAVTFGPRRRGAR